MITTATDTKTLCASGLVVKFNVAIVEPRVRFSAGACLSLLPPGPSFWPRGSCFGPGRYWGGFREVGGAV